MSNQKAAVSAKDFDYMKEALQTESPSFHGEMISEAQLSEVLQDCILALHRLDDIKKALFYKRAFAGMESVPSNQSAWNLLTIIENGFSFNCEETNIVKASRIIHAIIGKATESGELLEALQICLTEGRAFDEVNAIEEVGDGLWYDAILLAALESSFGEAQLTNINKLRARFPEKFTEYDAQNRNLDEERKILEKGSK